MSFMLAEVFHLIRQMKIFEMNNSIETIFKTTSFPKLKDVKLLNCPKDISVDQNSNRISELMADSSQSYSVDKFIDSEADYRVEITDMDRRVYRDINRCLKAPESKTFDKIDYELGFMIVIVNELKLTVDHILSDLQDYHLPQKPSLRKKFQVGVNPTIDQH